MSEGLRPKRPKLGIKRRLHQTEVALIARVLAQADNDAKVKEFNEKLNSIDVQEMPDGGMGSLYFVREGRKPEDRCFGARIAEMQFKDDDDVEVLVSVNVDTDGNLHELDIWKSDFSPVGSLDLDSGERV
jgi:hypothetical protein